MDMILWLFYGAIIGYIVALIFTCDVIKLKFRMITIDRENIFIYYDFIPQDLLPNPKLASPNSLHRKWICVAKVNPVIGN
jgi:hypothetical protein